jgi:hypothetical protein
MKKFKCILLIVCAVTFTSCSIFDTGPQLVYLKHAKIVGPWRWVQSTGGFGGITITPDCTGTSGRILIFKADHTYLSFQADTLSQNGDYTLMREDGNTIMHYKVPREYFPNLPPKQKVNVPDQRVTFKGNDTLILSDVCFDCFTNTYKRIKKR